MLIVLRCVEHDQAAENTLGITNYSYFLKEKFFVLKAH